MPKEFIKTPEHFRSALSSPLGLVKLSHITNQAFLYYYGHVTHPYSEDTYSKSEISDAILLHKTILSIYEHLFTEDGSVAPELETLPFSIDLLNGEEHINTLVGIILDAFDNYFELENLGTGTDPEHTDFFVATRKSLIQLICRLYMAAGDDRDKCDFITIRPIKGVVA